MKMQKDFDNWNKQKKQIDSEKQNRFYNAREIWWCSLGVNIGSEHDGTGFGFQRPILILKGLSSQSCLIAPLTSSANKHKFRVPIGIILGKEASCIISQIRVVDTKRLLYKVCFLDVEVFNLVRKTARDLF